MKCMCNSRCYSAGVDLGITAVHPLTGQSIPVFAADYVVSDYGTMAVMGVPAHDHRDKLFAEEHNLPSITVNDSSAEDSSAEDRQGILLNSDKVLKCVIRVYVSMHVRVYVSMHVRVYVSMHVRVYVSMHVRVYVSMHVRVYVSMHVRVYVSMHVRVYVSMHVRVYVCMHVRVYVCMHVREKWQGAYQFLVSFQVCPSVMELMP